MKKYRGRTEEERIECALKARDIEQAIEFLNTSRLLTESIYSTLQECRLFYVEEIPDEPDDHAPEGIPPGPPVGQEKPPTTKKIRSV